MSFQEKVEKIIANLDDLVNISQAIAIAEINAEMQFRIFNEGKAKENQSIGKYSKKHAEIRESKGLQTSFVDLTITTDLRQSIELEQKKIVFKNPYGKEISKANERIFKKRIFAPSEKESQIWIDVLNEEIAKLIS